MPRWGTVLAATAGVAAGGALLYGVYLTITPIVAEGVADTAPAASSTPTASPAPTTAATGCDWAALAPDERPRIRKDQPEGLPEARVMTPPAWECVGEAWTVTVRSAGGDTWRPGGTAQALYLEAPDGELLWLFDLRTDVAVTVLEADVAARLAWTARQGEGDVYQVVQVELETGTVIDAWGGRGVPSPQRVKGGGVWNVSPLGPLEGGGTLWSGYAASGARQSLFARHDGDDFRVFAAQKPLDNLVEDGAVNARGKRGVEVWMDADATVAVFLAQRREPEARPPASTGIGTWIIVDLVSDQWRVATAKLPDALCAPAPGTEVRGDYAEPGALQAVCTRGDRRDVYRLTVGGEPEKVEAFGP